VVAEVMGFEHGEALTFGRAVAGLNAHSKGVSLGLFHPTPKEVKEHRRKMRIEKTVSIDLVHRAVPAKRTDEGLRALSGESPIRPENTRHPLNMIDFLNHLRLLFPLQKCCTHISLNVSRLLILNHSFQSECSLMLRKGKRRTRTCQF
jgi:hypothetical protein